MATKKYDLAVKTGSYTNDNGEEKSRFENIGSVWEGNNGSYIVMKRTFNPAGVPFKSDSDSIFISMFEPKDDARKPAARPPQKATKSRPQNDMDDDIPDF